MKSLNRTLSLVLVLVMVFGLMGVASAKTSFTDDTTIQYQEAVGVMTGIGAINGYTDGSFAPKGPITREEAAKMITYAILGPTVAKSLSVSSTNFSDVETGRWSAPFISYCVSKGIINGMGDGKFDPTGNVTGFQLAKMLLCSAGYGKQGEYTGNSWDLNVAIDANRLGVFTSSKATSFNTAATREEAALYVFNALTKVELAVWSKTDEVYRAYDGTFSTPADTTIAKNTYGMLTASGVLVANQANTANAYTTVGAVNYNVKSGLDVIGHYVTVYYKSTYASAATPGVAYAVVDKSTVVNVSKELTTLTALNAAFGATLPTAAAGNVSYANYTKDVASVVGTVYDIVAPYSVDPGTYVVYEGEVHAYLAPATYTYDVVQGYTAPTATTTGLVDFTGAATDIVIPKTGDTTSATALTYATYKLYETPAVNDVVSLQSTGVFTTVTKATMTTGVVSSVVTTAGYEAITAGTTTYAKSAVFSAALGGDWTAASILNKTCAFFAGVDGKIVAIKIVDTSTDAGLFYSVDTYTKTVDAGYGASVVTNWVQGVDTTGKEVNYQVATAQAAALDGVDNIYGNADDTVNVLYSVATSYDSTLKATVATLTGAAALATNGHTTNTVAVTGGAATGVSYAATKIANNHYYAADTKFIFVSGTGTTLKATTATGAQTIANNVNFVYYGTKATDAATNYTVKYVVVASTPVATPVASSLVFAAGAFSTASATSYTNAAGIPSTAYVQKVFINGTATQIKTLNVNDSNGDAVAAGFYTYTIDAATGIYTLTPAAAGVAGPLTVTNVYNGLLTCNATLTDASASSAVITDVVFAADTTGTLSQTTSLAGLLGTVSNAHVYCVYSTSAAGVVTVSNIYVVTQAANA